jgi:hypothetical protein
MSAYHAITMRTYEFDVFVEADHSMWTDFLDRYEDPIFELFDGDVHPGLREGSPFVSCTITASTLDDAVRKILTALKGLELTPTVVEFYADMVGEAA